MILLYEAADLHQLSTPLQSPSFAQVALQAGNVLYDWPVRYGADEILRTVKGKIPKKIVSRRYWICFVDISFVGQRLFRSPSIRDKVSAT